MLTPDGLDVSYRPIHGDYVPQSKSIEDTITMTQYLPGSAREMGGGPRGAAGRSGR